MPTRVPTLLEQPVLVYAKYASSLQQVIDGTLAYMEILE
jgi:hypothetical protein